MIFRSIILCKHFGRLKIAPTSNKKAMNINDFPQRYFREHFGRLKIARKSNKKAMNINDFPQR